MTLFYTLHTHTQDISRLIVSLLQFVVPWASTSRTGAGVVKFTRSSASVISVKHIENTTHDMLGSICEPRPG